VAGGVAGVDGRARFDEDDVRAVDGHRLVVHSPWHDVQLPGSQGHLVVVQADGQRAAEYEEDLIGLKVAVAGELALGLDDPDVVVVEHGHGPRGPGFVEAGQGGRQVDGIGHRARLPDRRLDRAPGAWKGIGVQDSPPTAVRRRSGFDSRQSDVWLGGGAVDRLAATVDQGSEDAAQGRALVNYQ
jgi:hypothetical protein